ncbi:UPF0587 protein CG4646-like Protein [Tribolium castaneum]|uniref:UPF0587 protein CG4646-like Protein n=1 Tax=Tribolium castaneum TaxID=7070 RepID=D2A029_TRICA|nr:PREDICTED: UPF0587 protein CG4646 [Tribolium castaneum]XP_008192219.1 PREDICTED: UPF0587 protein CG4646 [Tribolium castaneum]XP_975460.1 PREDICTED: UPF0587 protein CG4646 [Tribolium castaneum]EFA01755.2 UPF0587 protein CG4646-like Protein [Tribolium castaneum]|eukprot:XP_008192218.1 PREDICTED: UPF0587 protein CG4646 [Tribolium castaneum]
MVKIGLQIKANLDHVEELYTNHPNYTFLLKLKCLNCGETSDKWHGITESETFPTKMGKTETHYLAKCKLCGRENSLDIIEGSNGKYTNEDQDKFKTIVVFDCRGIEPVEFTPGEGWVAKIEESGKVFNDVDLNDAEWVEYDDKIKESVGIYDLQSQFIKIK